MEPLPTDGKQTPQRPDHVPLWLHVLFSLLTCQSVLCGQKSAPHCRTPCLGGRAERPGLGAPHPTRLACRGPGVPLLGRPPSFPPSSPSVSGMPREAHPATCVRQLLDAFPHSPRCSHNPTTQGGVNTSRKFRKCRAPGLVWGLQKHPIFSRTRPGSLNFRA